MVWWKGKENIARIPETRDNLESAMEYDFPYNEDANLELGNEVRRMQEQHSAEELDKLYKDATKDFYLRAIAGLALNYSSQQINDRLGIMPPFLAPNGDDRYHTMDLSGLLNRFGG